MEKLISNLDLKRLHNFLLNGEPTQDYYLLSQLPSLDEMFSGNNYYAVIFQENPNTEVGHWLVLIKLDENDYELFDCLAEPPPQQIIDLMEGSRLTWATTALMAKTESLCGKWVMARLLSLPNTLEDFVAFFSKFKRKADQIVNFLINVPNPD